MSWFVLCAVTAVIVLLAASAVLVWRSAVERRTSSRAPVRDDLPR
ncbi:hypothetical protein ACFORO_28095 [Amycolatopsis halotolerans]|uniref:Uncharacterized protein n=1 Tax=Amycolatopsis halotolerans TaxID=330083 RepID=A0ABV7QR20_9PSEU